MNRYKCDHCGKEFEVPDFVTEPHGEKVGCCPYCHGWFEEMYECKICGEYFTDSDLENYVCTDCIYEAMNVERCIRYGEDCKESISVNGFIASIITPSRINEILEKAILEADAIVPIDCTDFVKNDEYWWAEKLVEERKRRRQCQ